MSLKPQGILYMSYENLAKKITFFLFIVSFVVATKAQKSAKLPDMSYTVSMERPESNTFQVN